MHFADTVPVKIAGKYKKVRVEADTVTSSYDIEAVMMQFHCDGITYPAVMVKPEVTCTGTFEFKFTGFDPVTGSFRDFGLDKPQKLPDNRPKYQQGLEFSRRLALLGIKWYCLHFVANHYDVESEKWQGGSGAGDFETAWPLLIDGKGHLFDPHRSSAA